MTQLVALGGGHSHAIALSLLGQRPMPNLRLTLISDVEQTPYSGMLPGLVAGFYRYEEVHIDLPPLARFAGAEFVGDRVVGLDLDNRRVFCRDRAPVEFDYLSINIGSTPAASVAGAGEYTTPVKPVPQFLRAWEQIEREVEGNRDRPLRLGIVGGGVGGVELALNMQANLHRRLVKARRPLDDVEFHLFHRDECLAPGHNNWVQRRLEKIARDRGIQVYLSETVAEITRTFVRCESGLTVNCDRVFWVVQASPPPWIKTCGLATDERGFVLVDATLRSVSHPYIFAAGDIATVQDCPRPKAGVFAVRQGKPLLENWRRAVEGQVLKSYIPQKQYLALIGTGDRNAIASWSCVGWQSPLLWQWKDRIDRAFMRRFSNF
ncbi:MAG: FAD-dependent oxidoreductase [Cyanobacteriota bacterium]|nr:FAD-dependent oxidoreductase [Cyanobacteriota bacterium]